MAEAVAIVSLITSIGSLIDLSAKVVSRLHEFTSKTSDLPESFQFLLIRLPLLTEALQRIQTQANIGIPGDATKALTAVVDSTLKHVSMVQTDLSKIVPPDGASKLERALKALKSLAKEDKVQQAVEKIHKDIDVLVLHQTTRNADTSDRILEELSKLSVAPPVSSQALGICLGQAPTIPPDAFIGRTMELQQLHDWLLPASHPHRQSIVNIVGMGGMGKTQLSLAHVRDCGDDYSSVFWVNAKDETSLRRGMAELSAVIFPDLGVSATQNADEEQLKIAQVRRWLSKAGNDRWLIIFDNYDDPHLPGIRSTTGYDIRSFFPTRSQGSIVITSRCTKLAFSTTLKLQQLKDVKTSVVILSQRAGQDLSHNSKVSDLVKRLSSLPLALATAGTYIRDTGISCSEYLNLYNSTWMDLFGSDTEELYEYEARTLSSTWTVSLNQVRSQNEDATELLRFLAFLNYNDIWYDLIKAGASNNVPWMQRITQSKVYFQRVMSKLHNYSLVELVADSYQVHPCLHNWLVESLNTPSEPVLFIAAVRCVANSIDDDLSPQFWATSRRLLEHIEQLESVRYHRLWQLYVLNESIMCAASRIANLESLWNWQKRAEQMYMRALAGYEKALGPDHISTLDTVNNLGSLYRNQHNPDKAEQMYMRALTGYEKALGPDHTSTLRTVNNLGVLYSNQGNLDKAEQMYIRALTGYKKALRPDHISTLNTVNNLSCLYSNQDNLDKAEQMYMRALTGYEKALGPEHISTLDTINNLGSLYSEQGNLGKAEQMYTRALAGYEKVLGPGHTWTLDAVSNLGVLYRDQDNLDKAEQMYVRALAGYEKALGPDHISTLNTVNNLGVLYRGQGNLNKTEQMYIRALAGYEKALGPNHTSTLHTVNNFGNLYRDQGNLDKAEQMYMRALIGYEKALEPDHTWTLDTVNNLGVLYSEQGNLDKAEQMYMRALTGYEKTREPNHASTSHTVNNLGLLYSAQGNLDRAEQMYMRALTGYERGLGTNHALTLHTVNNLGNLYRDQGNLNKAEQMYIRVKSVSLK